MWIDVDMGRLGNVRPPPPPNWRIPLFETYTLLRSLKYGLLNGGPAGLVYGFMFAWVGQSLQALVMAEMAEMSPRRGLFLTAL